MEGNRLPSSLEAVGDSCHLPVFSAPASPFLASYRRAVPLGKGLMDTQGASSSPILSAASDRMYGPCSGML